MRVKAAIVFVVACALLSSGSALLAHHSFSLEYDGAKTFSVKGTVSKVEWTNPHARFYVDVVENGKTTTWNIELASPSALNRNGWTSRTLKMFNIAWMNRIAAYRPPGSVTFKHSACRRT